MFQRIPNRRDRTLRIKAMAQALDKAQSRDVSGKDNNKNRHKLEEK
jgi:hypothetical protein